MVGKAGAFDRLEQSFHVLLLAGANVELRTVLMLSTVNHVEDTRQAHCVEAEFHHHLVNHAAGKHPALPTGWSSLYFDHARDFASVASALDLAQVPRIKARLFNFPLCTVPANYRHLAPPSILDWKRKYAPVCRSCRALDQCSGFFEWHPADALKGVRPIWTGECIDHRAARRGFRPSRSAASHTYACNIERQA